MKAVRRMLLPPARPWLVYTVRAGMTKTEMLAEMTAMEKLIKVVGAIVALGSFLWAIWTYGDTRRSEIEQQEQADKRTAETRRVEATKPFLERQLKLYTEATQAAAKIATSHDESTIDESVKRFWQLYWGELALVENKAVEGAMKRFGDGLRAERPRHEMEQLSLALAHACRDSLAVSWGAKAWESHYSGVGETE